MCAPFPYVYNKKLISDISQAELAVSVRGLVKYDFISNG